jgi:O-antigen ligase
METQKKSKNIDSQPQPESSAWERKILEMMKYVFFALPFFALINVPGLFRLQIFSKLMFFYLATELLGFLYVLLVFQNKKYLPSFFSNPAEIRKKNWILICATSYVAIVGISNLFSINPYKSFFGSISWENGFLTLLHFFLLFIVLASVFKKETEWLIFFRLNAVFAIWVSLSVLFQKIANNIFAPEGGFGNPGYLAGYLIFIVFGCLAFFFQEKSDSWRKVFASSSALGAVVILYATNIRGSQLGLAAGVFAFFLIILLADKNKTFKKIFAVFMLMVFVIEGCLSYYAISSGKVYSMFKRSNTVKTRLIAWGEGIKGFENKPLFGYGSENYISVFEKYFNPAYYNNGISKISSEFGMDMPHNKLIEVLVFNGVFALSAYLALFVAVLSYVYEKYQKTLEKKYAAFAGLFMAYFVHLFFLFDTVSSYALFFIFLAYLDSQFPNQQTTGPKRKEKEKYLVFAVASIFLLSGFYFVAKSTKASFDYGEALRLGRESDLGGSLEYLDKLRKDDVYWVEDSAIFNYLRNPVLDQLAKKTDQKGELVNLTEDEKNYFRRVIAIGERNYEKNPTLDYYGITLGAINNLAGNFDSSYWNKNISMMEKIINNGSRRYEPYGILAEAYGRLGQTKKIEALEKQAIELDPTYYYPYFVFGGIYLKFNEFKKSADLFEKSLENGCDAVTCYQAIADASSRANDFTRAIDASQQIAAIKINDPQAQVNLMLLYYNNKEYGKARELAQEIMRRFPATQKQIDDFLKILPK